MTEMLRPMAPNETAEMPFLDHLEELRWRLLWSIISLVAGVGIAALMLLRVNVIGWLAKPIEPYLPEHHLVYTHPGDPFAIFMQAAAGLGFLLALPVILYQLWAFLAPALYRKERRIVLGVVSAAILLFVAGAAMGFFIVLPLAIPWLMGFGTGVLEPMITASEYFGFAFSLTLAFGVAFELPVVLLGLAALGVVTPSFLARYRRHAILGAVIIGAFLTPGDMVWTTIAMAVPLYGLYEISILLSYGVVRRRQKAEAQRAAGEAAQMG
ncbi:MAG TPA: twin-arginine translocase subunit TatC [Gemmatimonadales bacterium]|nr:twin-arginine translocase subunit TatC [Gemmatimonadales bacterium]